MEWLQGNMLDYANDNGIKNICFTANNCLTQDGRLVMGAGAAKAVLKDFRDVDLTLGAQLLHQRRQGIHEFDTAGDYGLLKAYVNTDLRFGSHWNGDICVIAVQVKRDWRDNGIWKLTQHSLKLLAEYLAAEGNSKAVLNCPLIGHGGYRGREPEVMRMVEECLHSSTICVFTL